jgi:hypothetical protein
MARLSVVISVIFSINKENRCKTVCRSITINMPDELYEELVEI